MNRYFAHIGLEIHVQLLTRSKIFCDCAAHPGDEPNSHICPVCTGLPGTLPALNERAITLAYVIARALNCELAAETRFDRKNYFYPDLPKNYQISQFNAPIGKNGRIEFIHNDQLRSIAIRDIHLEEDAGKMIHIGDSSLLDYNRAGSPLLEIVTEPTIASGSDAETLLLQLRRIVRYLGAGSGNMEEGALRCDANVSVSEDSAQLGSKVEIKNMNSSRFVRLAIDYEIIRQTATLSDGKTVAQETRLWNENRDTTESMRAKEGSADYRYFPEPDLPPFRASEQFLATVEQSMVELPHERFVRFKRDFGVGDEHVSFLCEERSVADFFERCIHLGASPIMVATWLTGDARKMLRRHNMSLSNSPLTPKRLADILAMLSENRIHGKMAKQVLAAVFAEDREPAEILRQRGWDRPLEDGDLELAVAEAIREAPQAVDDIRSGNHRAVGYLMGEVMRQTSGRADPQRTKELILQHIVDK